MSSNQKESTMREVRKSLVIMIFLGCVVSISTPATADYEFSVKVINKTGGMLTNVYAYWKAKGSGNQKTCWGSATSIQQNESRQVKCADSANKKISSVRLE